MNKSLKSQEKIKKATKRMRVVLVIFLILVLLSNLFFLAANLIQSTALEDGVPPMVPFTKGTSFCSLSEDIHQTDFKKGTILIIKNQPTYEKGDKVIVDQTLTQTKEFSIDEMYDVGVIAESTDKGYKLILLSYDNKNIELESSAIIGRISSRVLFLGNIYNNILGVHGYILFGIIPILFLALLFFTMRYFTVSWRVEAEAKEEAKAQIKMQSSQPKQQNPPKQKKEKREKATNPVNEYEDIPQISSQTIRSVSKPKLADLIEEDDVKLYNEGLHEMEQAATREMPPMIFAKKRSQKIDVSIGESDEARPKLNLQYVNQSSDQPMERPRNIGLSPQQRKMLEKVNQVNADEMMRKITSKIDLLIHEEDEDIDGTRVNSNYSAASINEQKAVRAARVEESTQPIKLSADEIIALYRQGNARPSEEEKAISKANDEEVLKEMNKMYYDSDISHF